MNKNICRNHPKWTQQFHKAGKSWRVDWNRRQICAVDIDGSVCNVGMQHRNKSSIAFRSHCPQAYVNCGNLQFAIENFNPVFCVLISEIYLQAYRRDMT